MTQEEKKLLIKDLCGRLPYGVKVQFEGWDEKTEDYIDVIDTLYSVNSDEWVNVLETDSEIIIEGIKPYLFPMSSITEEQKKEAPFESSLLNAFINGHISLFEDEELTVDDIVRMLDWLNKNHFDYRGLIPKGLAIDATNKNIY